MLIDFTFPKTIFAESYSLTKQIDHVQSEMKEVMEDFEAAPVDPARLAKELFDLIGSAQTALYILQKNYDVDLEAAKAEVITKNRRRGYYLSGV